MFDLGPEKILFVMVFALVVFGPQRLPEVARSIGDALRTVRGVQDDVRTQIAATLHSEEPAPSRPVAAIETADDQKAVAIGNDPSQGTSFI